jgi:cell division protein FtsX
MLAIIIVVVSLTVLALIANAIRIALYVKSSEYEIDARMKSL